MKKCCLVILVALIPAGNVAAQGYIGLYSDPSYTSSNLLIPPYGVVTFYIATWTTWTDGSIASRWKLEIDPNANISVFQIDYQFTPAGDLFSGVVFDYGTCMTGNVLIAVVHAIGFQVPVCSWIDIVPDPASPSGSVEVVDCQGYKWIVTCNDRVKEMRLNTDGICEGGPG